MLRFLLRMLGFLCVAGGFVVLVLDGARSIANSMLLLTPLSDTVTILLRERYGLIQPMVERNIHPLLWDPVLVNLLKTPTALAALLLGFLLLRLGARPQPKIGILTRH